MPTKKPYRLLNNSRFYILASSVFISLIVISYVRLQASSDQVFYIRSEQLFGLLSIMYWYVALIISPLGYVVGKQRLVHLAFARRAIGVSACYFAALHISIAIWGQLGGISGITHLPDSFKLSMTGGFIAFIILFLMAMTSFDKIISFMTFRRWKWLHRLVYAGGILAVLHIWSVGTHLSFSPVQICAFIALSLLIGLESFRLITLAAKEYTELQSKDYFYTLVITIWLAGSVALFAIPGLIKNYHNSHHNTHINNTGITR
jgi:DMSO/TMAO reductase YedYZ heme-binding membrane subunit